NKPEELEFAHQMYRRALDVEPDFALAHAGLADLYIFKYMAYYDRSAEGIARAREHAERALQLEPLLAEGNRALGRYHMFTGSLQQAEQCMLKAIGVDPKYAVGYRTLGWLKKAQGDYDGALDWARRALELAPTDLETLLLLSQLHMGNGKYTIALSTLQRAIELGPDYGRAYYELGVVNLKLALLDAAIVNLELGCRYKGDPNCFIDAGFAHLVSEDYVPARQAFEQSIAEDYFPFVAHYFLGYMDLSAGQSEAAAVHFTAVIDHLTGEQAPGAGNPQVQVFRALAMAGLDQKHAAVELLDNLEPAAADNGELLANIARCHMLLGDDDAAVKAVEASLKAHDGLTAKLVMLDPHFAGIQDRFRR
ncbi:MAG: tetratricopeptide repeat protein, partial [candidate division Zixibacteria bacterium]|nr:tetratricopeptide repeat protein [candidate division Zixibacteria bacterium]